MDEEEITYKTLRKIQDLEKNSSQLTHITKQFYTYSQTYLKTLEQNLSKKQDTPQYKLFQDEFENTKRIIKNIYELREKKIVQAALSTIRGATPTLDNILPEEQTLFQTLIEVLENNRKNILHQPKKKQQTNKEQQQKSPKSANTNPIAQVIKDMPEFVGTDMNTYTLKKDDILSLPEDMSTILVKRKVIKQIK